jgi:type IV secretion system protein VirD4
MSDPTASRHNGRPVQPTLLPDHPNHRAEPGTADHVTAEPAPTWPCPFAWRWPGIRLGWLHHQPVYAGPQNATLLLGPPRSGKTTGIVAPAVTDAPGPVVATSTKADITDLTLPSRQQAGRCWYFDPSGTTTPPPGTTPARWSPIAGCQHWDVAVQRAHALAGAAVTAGGEHAHWTERAEALLAPLFHAAAVVDLDMIWPLRWVLRRDLTEPLRALTRVGAHELAADTLQGIADTDERERSGIFSTAARLLAAYRTPTAINTATNPNLDPQTFVHSRDTLYLVAPSHIQNQLAPIIISLLDQIRTATYSRHPSWPPTLYALDEAANIAPLPDLPAIIAEGASQGLVTLTCLQDLNQARHRWGPQADGFLTLHGIKIALGGIADTNTLRSLSYLAGNQDIVWTTHNSHGVLWQKTQGSAQTVQQRPRIPPEHIRQMPPGIAYLAHTTHQPDYITTSQPATRVSQVRRVEPWTWKRVRDTVAGLLDPTIAGRRTK